MHNDCFDVAFVGTDATAFTVIVIDADRIILLTTDAAFRAKDPASEAFDTFFFVKYGFEHAPAACFSHRAFFRIGQTCLNRIFLQKFTSV